MAVTNIMDKARRVFFTLALFLCLTRLAAAGDFQIVPGERIGSVALGMSEASVLATLHQPRFVRALHDGRVEDSWVTLLPLAEQKKSYKDGRCWKYSFVNVYFQQGRVVQVEVNSPLFHVGSLSVDSPASAFEKRFPHFLSSDSGRDEPLLYGTRDMKGGLPGYKHFVTIDDSVKQGIAWRYGSWGDLAPDPDPSYLEVIIVHRRGRRVIREPDAGNRFVQYAPDAHIPTGGIIGGL